MQKKQSGEGGGEKKHTSSQFSADFTMKRGNFVKVFGLMCVEKI